MPWKMSTKSRNMNIGNSPRLQVQVRTNYNYGTNHHICVYILNVVCPIRGSFTIT